MPTNVRTTALLTTLLLSAGATVAHNFPECAHTHTFGQFTQCNANNTPCLVTATKICKTIQSTIQQSATWCECVDPPQEDDDCFSALSGYLVPQIAGLPTADQTIVYDASFDPDNSLTLSLGSSHFVDDLGQEALQGTVTLHYGSFAVPTNVPVQVTAMNLGFPSVDVLGTSTGPHTVQIPPSPQDMVYDSTTGILVPAADAILIEVDNDIATASDVPFYMEGVINVALTDGDIQFFGQGAAPLPAGVIFFDGLETGDTTRWNAAVAMAVPPVAALVALLGWRLRERRRT